jgi:hypothetical protein
MLLSPEQYKTMRENYCYSDRNCIFTLVKTDAIEPNYVKTFEGIFSGVIPPTYPNGINLRQFELIVQAVFSDCLNSTSENAQANLKQIICAIAHWKMASQGGRSKDAVKKVEVSWDDNTYQKLMDAYENENVSLFRIGGVKTPTATTILRFIYPNKYGIMDSRVAKVTNDRAITELKLRLDGYINDTKKNVDQFKDKYIPFLIKEAVELNNAEITFNDLDINGNAASFLFRPCDIEMALFSL